MSKRKSPPSSDTTEHELAPKRQIRTLFKHTPLKQDTKQIRLFKLNRSNARDGWISGDLESFDLDQCPPYMALSYTWEKEPTALAVEERSNTIFIGVRPFDVRPNLFDFLLTYSEYNVKSLKMAFHTYAKSGHDPCTPYLWIDQLCIDQASTLERNHQVNMMREIYVNANHVIVWLPCDAATTWALGTIITDPHNSAFPPVGDGGGLRTEAEQLEEHYYWTRLWILQEIILAKEATIFGYDLYVSWERILALYGNAHEEAPSTLEGITNLCKSTAWTKKFHAILQSFCGQQCKDPRDRVYGLLGLVPEQERLGLMADYSIPVEQLFVDVSVRIIRLDCRGHMKPDIGFGYTKWLIALSCQLAQEMGIFLEAHHFLTGPLEKETIHLSRSDFDVYNVIQRELAHHMQEQHAEAPVSA